MGRLRLTDCIYYLSPSFQQCILGEKHEKLAETRGRYISTTSTKHVHFCYGQYTAGIKIQLVPADWEYRGKREVSGLTLDLSLSVFILRCHNSVRDVICSASDLFKSLQMLFFVSLGGRRKMNSGKKCKLVLKCEIVDILISSSSDIDTFPSYRSKAFTC